MRQAKEEAGELVRRMEKEIAEKSRIEREKKARIEEQEKERMKLVEMERKRLWEQEMEKQKKEIDEERHLKMEENRRIAKELTERKEREAEEQKRIKREVQEEKLRAVEEAKKKTLEDKKKSLFEKNKFVETAPIVPERPKKKSVNNPMAQKFEEMAKSAEAEDMKKKEMAEKKNKIKQVSKNMIRRSRQMLNRMSKENLKGSPALQRKKSRENMLKISVEKIKQSRERIKASRDNLRKSKTCINNAVHGSGPVSRKEMQNFLISQVLFDGEEAVSSASRHRLDQQRIQEEENKRKELEMIRREQEVKKQIEEQLRKIKEAEEQQRLKQQEANFEAYKKEMESYLNFVCEDKEPVKSKKKVKRKEEEPKKKLKLNIKGIKDQFENVQDTPPSAEITSATPTVNKLDPSKFKQMETQRRDSVKKEYVPVIIDKAAFERTTRMFEKEQREEEEKLRQEERLRQRREKMQKEKERLIAEKKRKEEEEKQALIEMERLRQREYEEEQQKYQKMNEEPKEELKEPEESPEEKKEREQKLQKMDIQERIRLELEKIRELEEKQKEVIQRENKKKELMRQIQMEVEKIKGSDKEPEDHTPDWIKMIMNKKPSSDKPKSVKPQLTHQEPVSPTPKEDMEEDIPKWMKIFQEKSQKLEEMKIESDKRVAEREREVQRRLEERERQEQHTKLQQEKQKQTILNKIEKSKTDAGIYSRDTEEPNDVDDNDVPVKPKPVSVKDRVKKVKSLILDKDLRPEKKEKVKIKVEKNKASKIKHLFESTQSSEENRKEVTRPKKKIVKMPVSDVFFSDLSASAYGKPKPQVEREWKWKAKTSQELHDFINSNKDMLPDSLSKKAHDTFEDISEVDSLKENDQEDEKGFENYIESVQEYLNQEDEDETESIFKDTIQAYLDLIDTKPKVKKQLNKKEVSSIQPVNIKERMKDLERSNKESPAVIGQNIGKVDSTFLLRSNQEEEKRGPGFITTDMCSSLKNKYENMSSEKSVEEPLYSMKRKLIPGREDIDSMAWKKQQTEIQWKYKQKTISELQNFISQSKTSKSTSESPVTIKPYVPVLPNIDFAARLADEEKRMEEFESFMEGIHEYLEKDTANETESDFKWQIQSYLDFIEDEQKPPISARPQKVEKKAERVSNIEGLQSTAALKQKLFEGLNKTIEKESVANIGRVNTSFLENQSTEYQGARTLPDIKENHTKSMRDTFEQDNSEEQTLERIVVRKKLFDPMYPDEKYQEQKPEVKVDWKYKKKTLNELQSFINSNKDMAPKCFLDKTLSTSKPKINASELLNQSSNLNISMQEKENDFENFMKELETFTSKTSATDEEVKFKTELRGYLDLIDTEKRYSSQQLPLLSNTVSISNIQGKLEKCNQSPVKKQDSKIGKVSTFFKKSTSESCNNSKLMKENIANLLQPGKAKLMKDSFETKPKLKRSVSEMEINPGKINVKNFFMPEEKPKDIKVLPKNKGLFSQFRSSKQSVAASHSIKEVKQTVISPPEPKQTWSRIEDPEERKNAILAKYGFKPAKKVVSDEEDSDIEDYLNYENTEEITKYEQELRDRYSVLESSSPSRESSPVNTKGSFSSLLNILQTMRKGNTAKKYSDSRSKVNQFSDGKQSKSKSEIDLSEISGSCSNIKGLFENRKVFSSSRRKSMTEEDEYLKDVSTANKRDMWEGLSKAKYSPSRKETGSGDINLPSINQFKSMFEAGELDKQKVHEYIESRSVVGTRRKDSSELAEEDFDGSLGVEAELDALRRSSKMKMMNRLERGDGPSRSQSAGLRYNILIM